jgi:hypothetical protein
MKSRPSHFWDSVLYLWPLRSSFKRRHSIQQCVLHDPEAQKPKDLDDPFREVASQGRVGDLIGRTHPELRRK